MLMKMTQRYPLGVTALEGAEKRPLAALFEQHASRDEVLLFARVDLMRQWFAAFRALFSFLRQKPVMTSRIQD